MTAPFGPARPFVKWVGGKRSIIEPLLARLPARMDAYYEPFLGGGAVFFALANEHRVRSAHLSDANERLVTTYKAVRDDVEAVIALLRRHARLTSKGHFYRVRERLNSGRLDEAQTAAAFIYLNKVCFNGVWRVNRDGAFNVPWGHHKRPYVPDEDGLRAASAALARASISHHEFDATLIDPDGFYYFDPPYDGAYAGYSRHGFGPEAHGRLADFTEKLDAAGAHWLLSNADTLFVRQLYKGRTIEVVESRRTVSRSAAGRGTVGELLVRARAA